MVMCVLDLDKLSEGGKRAKLQCYGVGEFDIYTGDVPYTNRIECAHITNSAIPRGKYWIVDRPTGGIRTKTQTALKDLWTGNDHSIWFGLYRDDGLIDDYTWINGVQRGNFRLHPNRIGGTSWGCITFYHHAQFMILRSALLRMYKSPVPNTNLKAYGTVEVIGRDEKICNDKKTS